MRRAAIIVLDGMGVGAADDASAYGTVRPRGARRATELFARHYPPALPVPTVVREGLWDRCEGPGGRRGPRVRDKAAAEPGVVGSR